MSTTFYDIDTSLEKSAYVAKDNQQLINIVVSCFVPNLGFCAKLLHQIVTVQP